MAGRFSHFVVLPVGVSHDISTSEEPSKDLVLSGQLYGADGPPIDLSQIATKQLMGRSWPFIA